MGTLHLLPRPESMGILRKRFMQALEPTYSMAEVAEEGIAGKRKHVFDTDVGLRLIISREILPEHGNAIHVVGEIGKGEVYDECAEMAKGDPNAAVVHAIERTIHYFRNVACFGGAIHTLGFSREKMNPHLCVRWDDFEAGHKPLPEPFANRKRPDGPDPADYSESPAPDGYGPQA